MTRTVCLPGFVAATEDPCPCPSVAVNGTPSNKLLMVDNTNRPSPTSGGSEGQVAMIVGGIVSWGNPTASVALTGTLSSSIVTADGSNLLAKSGAGSNGQLATVASGHVAWANPSFSLLTDTISTAQAPLLIPKADATGWLVYDSGLGKLVFKPNLPAVYNAGTLVATYSTIQAAITAATSGQYVEIPPGLWNEHITLKNGVYVVEAFPGTVILTNTNPSDGVVVTTADGGYLQVSRIYVGTVALQTRGINSVHSANCTIIVRRILIDGAPAGYGVFGDATGGGGTLYLYVDEIIGTTANTVMAGVEWDLGTLYLYLRGQIKALASGTAKGINLQGVFSTPVANIFGGSISGGTLAIDNSNFPVGTLTLSGCYYDKDSVAGSILYGEGDRASIDDAVLMPLMYAG